MKRRTWPYLLIGLIIVGAAAVSVARPSKFFGVDRDALIYSFDANDCQPAAIGGSDWVCTRSVLTQPGSKIVEYRYLLTVDSWGCWKVGPAALSGSTGAPEPEKTSACITFRDILRLFSYKSAGGG